MIDFTLMQHQTELIWKSLHERDLFIAWEVGTGKTSGTIQLLRHRYQENQRQMKTLIICPVIVQKNWAREIQMFSKIPEKSVHVLTGPLAKRIEFIKQCTWNGVIIINYDVFQSEELTKAILEWGPEILVCDEAHLLKNYKSKRAKNIAKIADRCAHRYLLTGTPILNSAMDLFMPFRVLDGYLGPKATFGDNFFVFRAKYFEDENAAWASKPNYFPKWVPRPTTYKELSRKIEQKMSQVKKADCLDLPPLVTETIEVEMTPEMEKVYKELKRDFVSFIESKKGEPRAVVAKLAVTKALRMHQVTTGFAKLDDQSIHRFKDVPRVEMLKQLLQDITPDHKVIVWATFVENYDQIRGVCDEIGVRYTELHGGISSTDKFRNVDAFNKDPDVRVCIGHPAAGGVGINLISASYSIYFSRSFRLGDDIQSEARNYRRGSEIHDKITRINLITPNSIDELISNSLEQKTDIAEKILDMAAKL